MPANLKPRYDVIVVGAGSAGCAAAARLAQNSRLQILLLEAGSAARNPMISIPLGFAFLLKPHANNWSLLTEPEPGLGGREVSLPRGKVLGGCSAINGMVYIRGQAEDYDAWANAGCDGWSYSSVLPVFKASEDWAGPADDFHGVGGPLHVAPFDNEFPVCDAFIAAAEQAGWPVNPDVNGGQQEGVGWFPATIRNGRRQTSADAFLGAKPAPSNLQVVTGVTVHRIQMRGGRAVGLECELAGAMQTVAAEREIVLAAGAIHSPQLLELSGIGDTERLQTLGIAVAAHVPGVGENLQDHYNGYIKIGLSQGKSYFSESRPLAMLKNVLRYVFRRQGMLANPAALVSVFYRALADSRFPDAQIHFSPAASELDAKGNMLPIDAVTVASCGLRPQSRGSVHCRSADPAQAPEIRVNYLKHPEDRRLAIAAFREARRIIAQGAFDAYRGVEVAPGEAVRSDEDILAYLQQTGEPVHHLAGSCRMGSGDDAVVNSTLQVRGVDGLRVADASIMPSLISGNTHAACVMIGERVADFILNASDHQQTPNSNGRSPL